MGLFCEHRGGAGGRIGSVERSCAQRREMLWSWLGPWGPGSLSSSLKWDEWCQCGLDWGDPPAAGRAPRMAMLSCWMEHHTGACPT